MWWIPGMTPTRAERRHDQRGSQQWQLSTATRGSCNGFSIIQPQPQQERESGQHHRGGDHDAAGSPAQSACSVYAAVGSVCSLCISRATGRPTLDQTVQPLETNQVQYKKHASSCKAGRIERSGSWTWPPGGPRLFATQLPSKPNLQVLGSSQACTCGSLPPHLQLQPSRQRAWSRRCQRTACAGTVPWGSRQMPGWGWRGRQSCPGAWPNEACTP
jgi:hypothetical protein